MGRESDPGAALTGARGGGTDTGRRRCGRGVAVGGGEGFFGGRRGRVGKKSPVPVFSPKLFGSSPSETVVNINRL